MNVTITFPVKQAIKLFSGSLGKISTKDLLIYSAIASYGFSFEPLDDDSGLCDIETYVTTKALVNTLKIPREAIYRSIRRLKDVGLLTKDEFDHYHIVGYANHLDDLPDPDDPYKDFYVPGVGYCMPMWSHPWSEKPVEQSKE